MPASAPTARPSTASLSSFAGSDAAAGTSTGKKVTGARADRRELNRMLGKLAPGEVVGDADWPEVTNRPDLVLHPGDLNGRNLGSLDDLFKIVR